MGKVDDDLIQRLKNAHENSQQRIMGSNIFEEAATALEAKDAEIARLQGALSFWMPGVDLRLDDATRELAASDAELLAGYAGSNGASCWGDGILERAITAESRISDLERQLAEETERCAVLVEEFPSTDMELDIEGIEARDRRIAAAIRGCVT